MMTPSTKDCDQAQRSLAINMNDLLSLDRLESVRTMLDMCQPTFNLHDEYLAIVEALEADADLRPYWIKYSKGGKESSQLMISRSATCAAQEFLSVIGDVEGMHLRQMARTEKAPQPYVGRSHGITE